MLEIVTNLEKKYFIMTLKGYMDEVEIKAAVDQVIETARSFKPGFTIINDMSELKAVSQTSAEYIKKGLKFVSDQGVRRVIRVEGSPIAQMQFKRVQRESETPYEVVWVATPQEAKRLAESE